jgi:uncharacterized phage infection (PIP) family protein YhgE
MNDVYNQFVQSGNTILEKSEPDSENAKKIGADLADVVDGWEKLQNQLKNREDSLKSLLGPASEYYDTLHQLNNMLPMLVDKMAELPPISSKADVIEEQKQQMKVIFFITVYYRY